MLEALFGNSGPAGVGPLFRGCLETSLLRMACGPVARSAGRVVPMKEER
jgi:hypothetical protein